MAWTTPGTAVAGEVLTAAFWNEQVRDNLTELRKYQTQFKISRLTSGNLTLNNTSWTAISTGTDLVLSASAGDVIQTTLWGLLANQAVVTSFDVVTRVSGASVNSVTSGTTATADYANYVGAGWYAPSGADSPITGSCFYTLQAGDISANTVTLRQVYAQAGATNRTLLASTTVPWIFSVKNHGPAV